MPRKLNSKIKNEIRKIKAIDERLENYSEIIDSRPRKRSKAYTSFKEKETIWKSVSQLAKSVLDVKGVQPGTVICL
jgi:hypothetical protein